MGLFCPSFSRHSAVSNGSPTDMFFRTEWAKTYLYIFSGYTASAAFPCQSSKTVCLEHPQY
jgi:hypothetical protein